MFCIHRTQGKSNDMDNQQALLQQSWVFLFVCFTLFCFSFGVVFHLYLNTSSEKALYALYALDTCRLADHPFIVGNLLFITLNLDFHSLIDQNKSPSHFALCQGVLHLKGLADSLIGFQVYLEFHQLYFILHQHV